MVRKTEYIELTDGREVRECPWMQEVFVPGLQGSAFEVSIEVVNPKSLQDVMPAFHHRYYKLLTILKLIVPSTIYLGSVATPKIEILESELWTNDLVNEVILFFRLSSVLKKRPNAQKYVIGKLASAFKKEKELSLPDGRLLIGNLNLTLDKKNTPSSRHENLLILGDVKDTTTGTIEQIILFTVKNLYTTAWSGSVISPSYEKNKDVWCKKLEYLVISYLNLLVNFSERSVGEQISKIADQLSYDSDWAKTCREIHQILWSLDSDEREDAGVRDAFQLIKDANDRFQWRRKQKETG